MDHDGDESLFSDLPTPSELRRLAQAAGHDSLAIANDTEACRLVDRLHRYRVLRSIWRRVKQLNRK